MNASFVSGHVGRPSLVARLAAPLAALLLALTPALLRAQEVNCDPGDLEVRSLEFRGNEAFSDAELANAVVTTPSNVFQRVWGLRPLFGEQRCVGRNDIILDRARLVVYYRKRGYADVAVDTVIHEAGKDRIDVTYRIDEGRPTLVDSLVVSGLSDVPNSARITRNLPVRVGRAFDQYQVEVARDSIRRRLTNTGYPFAEVLVNSDVLRAEDDSTRRVARLSFEVIPGARARIGEIALEVEPRAGSTQQIPDPVVRELLGLRSGRTFRQVELERATRRLYQSEGYQHVKVEFVADSAHPEADSVVDVHVAAVERAMRSASVSAGYGTLDCLRAQGEYTNRNFLRGARRLELTGRLSKIGVGDPLDVNLEKSLCPQTDSTNDPFSDKLNYYAGATIRQPVLLGLHTIPDITLYSERRSEYRAYRRDTPIGGIASLTRERFRRTPITFSYELSYGRTQASPALFCAVFNRCEQRDREVFTNYRRLAVAGIAAARDRTDDALNPSRGSFIRLTLRHASSLVFSDTALQFTKLVGDASRYWRLGRGNVLALRLQAGTVLGGLDRTLPPQERLFAGGPTTVRGFRQNELGPAVYVVEHYDTVAVDAGAGLFRFVVDPAATGTVRVVPTGGNSVVVGNAELRLRSPFLSDLLQYTLFTDVGEVWNRRGGQPNLSFKQLQVTPGFGVRVFSPVGAIRLDLGYNRYRPRAGAAYWTAPLDQGDERLLCVSPGNAIPVRQVGDALVQDDYTSCASSLQPARAGSFLRRFTFFFAIGQAF